MAETGCRQFNDCTMADGTYNRDWCYSLWLEEEEDYTYICLIERA